MEFDDNHLVIIFYLYFILIIYKMARKCGSKRRHSRGRKMRGGAGTATWANEVYGGPGNQHAMPGGNVIYANTVGGTSADNLNVSDVNGKMLGGNRNDDHQEQQQEQEQQQQEQQQQGGQTIIADLGVPAALIYARQLIQRRSNRKKSARRRNSKKRISRRRR